jgi:hypothetical protein
MSMASASNGFRNFSTAMMAGDLARPDTALNIAAHAALGTPNAGPV